MVKLKASRAKGTRSKRYALVVYVPFTGQTYTHTHTHTRAPIQCKKEAITDATKRALRTFGNLLGNCLYDKNYVSEIGKMKAPKVSFHSHAGHAITDMGCRHSRSSVAVNCTEARAWTMFRCLAKHRHPRQQIPPHPPPPSLVPRLPVHWTLKLAAAAAPAFRQMLWCRRKEQGLAPTRLTHLDRRLSSANSRLLPRPCLRT